MVVVLQRRSMRERPRRFVCLAVAPLNHLLEVAQVLVPLLFSRFDLPVQGLLIVLQHVIPPGLVSVACTPGPSSEYAQDAGARKL